MKPLMRSRHWFGVFVAATALLFAGVTLANCPIVSGNVERTPDSRFTINPDQTVTDNTTKLVWKPCAQGRSGPGCATGTAAKFTWQEALRQSVTDTFGGFTDWRLPSQVELLSLVETACRNPTINTSVFPVAFPQVPTNAIYWTSRPGTSRSQLQSWAVDFNRGSTALNDKALPNYVRLVRAGNGALDSFNLTSSITGGPSPLPVFTAVVGANTNAYLESNIVTLAGVTGALPISVAGGEYRINSGAYTSAPGTVSNGNTVQVRLLASAVANTEYRATLTINYQAMPFSVTTGAVNEPTNAGFFSLADLVLNTEIRSNTITVTGLTASRSVSIEGDATAAFSINGGAWTSAATTISNGQTIQVRMTSAGTIDTTRTATLIIFGRRYPFSITTYDSGRRSTASEPANFVLVAKENQTPAAVVISDPVTVTGISTAKSINCNQYRIDGGSWTACPAGGNYGFRINGGAWSSGATSTSIANNSTLEVRGVAPAGGSLLEVRTTINSRDYIFFVRSAAEPDNIVFFDRDLLPKDSWAYSNTVQVTGLTQARAISISGASGQYRTSTDGYTWSGWTATAGTIAVNAYVEVRLLTSATANTLATATLTINGRSFTFNATSGTTEEVPSGLYFMEQYGAPANAVVQSEVLTVGNVSNSATISVTGGAYQKNGAGGFVSSAGSVVSGDTMQMQVTTAACGNTGTTANLVANGYSYPFTVYTGTLTQALSFATRSNVCASAVIYSAFSPTLCSENTGGATITGGTSPGIERNDSATWGASSTLVAGDKIRLRHTASATAGASTTATMTVNGKNIPFTVTTRAAAATDPPASSVFADKAATAGQVGVESNEVMVDLCTARTATLAVAGGGGAVQYAYCSDVDSPCTTWGAWNNTGVGTIPVGGRAVKLKVNAGGAGTTTTVTMTINGVASTFRVLVP